MLFSCTICLYYLLSRRNLYLHCSLCGHRSAFCCDPYSPGQPWHNILQENKQTTIRSKKSTNSTKQVFLIKEDKFVHFFIFFFFRYGQPDLLNNNDNLLRDLLSTRNKGVDENSRNILNQTNPLSGHMVQPLFPSPPLEISRRSSLLSFFQDTKWTMLMSNELHDLCLTGIDIPDI